MHRRFTFLLVMVLVVAYATAAAAMGDNLIGKVADQAQQWFADKWADLFDPIYWWYALWIIGLVVAGVIATFVPFKIVRLTLGIALLFGAAFVAGGRQMGMHQRARIDALRAQLKEEKTKRQGEGGGGQAGGGSFFDWFK